MPKRQPIKILPPVAFLRECFTYNRRTGVLRWRDTGAVAGRMDAHRHRVKIGNLYCKTARIIWKLVTGRDAKTTIDHKNGDPFDNRWSNLRLATMKQQSWNRKLVKNNTSGYRCVTWSKKDRKWYANIRHNGVTRYVGGFDDAKRASIALERTAKKLRGEFYRKIYSS